MSKRRIPAGDDIKVDLPPAIPMPPEAEVRVPSSGADGNGITPIDPSPPGQPGVLPVPKTKKAKPPRDPSLSYLVCSIGEGGPADRVMIRRRTLGQAKKAVQDASDFSGIPVRQIGVYRCKRVA